MGDRYAPFLAQIAGDRRHLIHLTYEWSRINSGSYHLDGLRRMQKVLADNFLWLGGEMTSIDLAPQKTVDAAGEIVLRPLGQALKIVKRPEAKLQMFLGGHMDTVYGQEHPFQDAVFENQERLRGPGVADLKGGLVVMLKALEALEKSPWAEAVGWTVLINPDEELGSPGSAPLFAELAPKHHLGLLYEPALEDGTMVDARKGSGNFHLVVRGRSAHAGRDHAEGRNALVALAEALLLIDGMNGKPGGITVNPAKIEGGEPLNVVPDLGVLRFNVRVATADEQARVEGQIIEIVERMQKRDGITLELHGGFGRGPKPVSPGMMRLKGMIEETAGLLNQPVGWGPSGGVCDGNNLAAAGLANIDTLGVRGGAIHSDKEFVILESLVERAQLSALLLMRLASGELVF